jgi:rhodanese-related sulfurtransferase
MKRVSPKEAKALLDEGWTYVDVRSEPEFQEGHPAGALNVPLMHAGPAGLVPNPDFLPVMERAISKDTKLVLGCRSGGRSMRAAQLLEGAGYLHVVDQRAGFGGALDQAGRVIEPGWAAEKLPVESGNPAKRCYSDLAKQR